MDEVDLRLKGLCAKIDYLRKEIREWEEFIDPHRIYSTRNFKIYTEIDLLKIKLRRTIQEREEIEEKITQRRDPSFQEICDQVCTLLKDIKEDIKVAERRKSELQVSTPNTNEVVEGAKCVETIVEVEEIVACDDNENVVDISMPITTMSESSEDEVAEKFVVECIEEVIDISESVTTLDNNKCAVTDVETNEVSANFNK